MMRQTREERLAVKKIYRDTNRDTVRESNRKYRESNRDKIRKWNKKHRDSHMDRYRELQREYAKKIIRDRKTEAILNFGGSCSKCGYSFTKENIAAFDFHHKEDSSKKDGINFRLLNYKEELKKCILLCSNCHRILHQNEGGCHNSRYKCKDK